ncbi:hypothetical protein [Polaromonas sp. LjRoot131]|uniref:hypothetical protein n=1 Tax=Polaromonas sp. LjRoot131 TaxID=3342262 RepID=UPI003ECDEF60
MTPQQGGAPVTVGVPRVTACVGPVVAEPVGTGESSAAGTGLTLRLPEKRPAAA